jgi:hypothetical protein
VPEVLKYSARSSRANATGGRRSRIHKETVTTLSDAIVNYIEQEDKRQMEERGYTSENTSE